MQNRFTAQLARLETGADLPPLPWNRRARRAPMPVADRTAP
jgi:hypothetical protein